jgi:hypothetical protein
MALTQIDFSEKEEEKIKQYSKKWNTNKPKTIIKMIEGFEEELKGGKNES